MRRAPVIVAFLLVSLLAGLMFRGLPYVGPLFVVGTVIAFMMLGAALLKNSSERKYTDPYDLRLLKDIHERSGWTEPDEMQIAEDADVVCPHCGHVYGYKFKVCPQCKCSA